MAYINGKAVLFSPHIHIPGNAVIVTAEKTGECALTIYHNKGVAPTKIAIFSDASVAGNYATGGNYVFAGIIYRPGGVIDYDRSALFANADGQNTKSVTTVAACIDMDENNSVIVGTAAGYPFLDGVNYYALCAYE